MPRMIAMTSLIYDRQQVEEGETFECDHRDMQVLTVLRRARIDDGADPVSKSMEAAPVNGQAYLTRDMKQDASSHRDKQRSRGRYARDH